jgi:hypothetical protein
VIGDPGRAPLANTNLLLILSAGRMPVVTCGPVPEDPAVYRLSVETLGQGYGVNVHVRGPIEQLEQLTGEIAAAVEGCQRQT